MLIKGDFSWATFPNIPLKWEQTMFEIASVSQKKIFGVITIKSFLTFKFVVDIKRIRYDPKTINLEELMQ